jgi:hypothetical protein
MDNNEKLFTQEEEELLLEANRIRMSMIKEKIKDGMPVKAGDIRVINEVLGGVEGNIFGRKNIELKKKDTDVAENNGMVVAEIFRQLSTANGRAVLTELAVSGEPIRPHILPETFTNVEVVEGELDINPEPLNKEDFLTVRRVVE